MRLFTIGLLIVFITGCSRSKLAPVIDHTSSIEIHFIDTISKKVTGIHKTNFAGEINMLNKYFTGADAPAKKCNSDGKIILKGKDTVEVDFYLTNNCQHISFMLDGAEHSEDISLDGIGYLKKLKFKVETIPALVPADSIGVAPNSH